MWTSARPVNEREILTRLYCAVFVCRSHSSNCHHDTATQTADGRTRPGERARSKPFPSLAICLCMCCACARVCVCCHRPENIVVANIKVKTPLLRSRLAEARTRTAHRSLCMFSVLLAAAAGPNAQCRGPGTQKRAILHFAHKSETNISQCERACRSARTASATPRTKPLSTRVRCSSERTLSHSLRSSAGLVVLGDVCFTFTLRCVAGTRAC